MTDIQEAMVDFAARQADRAARVDARLERLKQAVIPPLREAGIVSAEVRFDGYGDSGAVEECTCVDTAGTEVPCPETTVEDLPEEGADNALPVRQMSLQSALEDLAYLALERHHPGWENNEGAGGTLEIEVAAETFMLDRKVRYIEYDDHYTTL